jgi:hypothetical protein
MATKSPAGRKKVEMFRLPDNPDLLAHYYLYQNPSIVTFSLQLLLCCNSGLKSYEFSRFVALLRSTCLHPATLFLLQYHNSIFSLAER